MSVTGWDTVVAVAAVTAWIIFSFTGDPYAGAVGGFFTLFTAMRGRR